MKSAGAEMGMWRGAEQRQNVICNSSRIFASPEWLPVADDKHKRLCTAVLVLLIEAESRSPSRTR